MTISLMSPAMVEPDLVILLATIIVIVDGTLLGGLELSLVHVPPQVGGFGVVMFA